MSFITVRSLLPILFLCLAQSVAAQENNIKSFIFGHSLINHALPIVPIPSQETTVPFWMAELAAVAGKTYAATGQYGFLPQHANLPPVSNWGFENVPFVWDSEVTPFAQADFNNILITAGNFVQWQPPHFTYPDETFTPISLTSEIIDWITDQEPGLPVYIYENWPDMAPFAGGGFPVSAADFADYNDYTRGDFHDWWIDYHNALVQAHSGQTVKMIPVGPILSDLLEDTPLSNIPLSELYEDDAPHGRATIYFLASLVTYMATYEMPAPVNFTVPTTVHPLVATNYTTTVNFIWSALNDFNFTNGSSRVFINQVLPVEWGDFSVTKERGLVRLEWNTVSEINNEKFSVEHSVDGRNFKEIAELRPRIDGDYTAIHQPAQSGRQFYRIRQLDYDGVFSLSPVRSLDVDRLINSSVATIFPNPVTQTNFILTYLATGREVVEVLLRNSAGQRIFSRQLVVEDGAQSILLERPDVPAGIYLFEVLSPNNHEVLRLVIP